MPPRLLLLAALFLFAGDAPSETESRPEILTYRSRHWILQLPAELAARRSAESWGAAADRRLEEIAGRLGVKLAGEPLHLYLDDSTRRLEERSGSDAPFTLLPDRREVAHLIAPDGTITDASGDAFLLLHLAWGPPPSGPLAAAVARFGAGDFHGQPLPVYAARVIREEEPYTLREILRLVPSLDKNEGQLSPLVCDALGGAWVEHLRARRGPGVLRRLWTAQAEEKADAAAAQLARIRALGANAVSIVPYGFTRAPDEPIVRYLGTDESEDRILRTMEQARRQGLKTVLKPQLWAPRRFTGDIVFERPADFDRWWAGYRRWMLHHARVAALGRADVLVIGTELGGVTRHRDAWRGLIRDVRRIYPGPLTYAANWAGDFETMPFWGDLDLLGLNMYYPLAGPGEMPRADSPRVRELRTKLAAMARRYGKPVLFTEVGYAASAAAAAEPWKEDHGPLDPAMQARCYEVVFEAFSREPWLAGLFWWKWPSHGQGSADDPSFSPLGKPALGVLERWYAPTPGPSPAKRERGEG